MKNKVRKILMILSCLISLSFTLPAQNPYLPLWEFIPEDRKSTRLNSSHR